MTTLLLHAAALLSTQSPGPCGRGRVRLAVRLVDVRDGCQAGQEALAGEVIETLGKHLRPPG